MPSFTFPTICWMYYYRLQINWVSLKKKSILTDLWISSSRKMFRRIALRSGQRVCWLLGDQMCCNACHSSIYLHLYLYLCLCNKATCDIYKPCHSCTNLLTLVRFWGSFCGALPVGCDDPFSGRNLHYLSRNILHPFSEWDSNQRMQQLSCSAIHPDDGSSAFLAIYLPISVTSAMPIGVSRRYCSVQLYRILFWELRSARFTEERPTVNCVLLRGRVSQVSQHRHTQGVV
jgi:hypothetical protein